MNTKIQGLIQSQPTTFIGRLWEVITGRAQTRQNLINSELLSLLEENGEITEKLIKAQTQINRYVEDNNNRLQRLTRDTAEIANNLSDILEK